MKKKVILIGCLFFAMLSPALGQDKGSQTWSAKGSGGDYIIGAADILDISTWKEVDFSRENILVRMDGKISFPLLNDVQAAGLTTAELKRIIEQGLKNYVSHPVVTVTVRNPASQRYYVLGEVARTGEYPLIKNMTVLQAFAVAGGFTQWASKDEIILVRRDGGKDNVYRVNYKEIAKGRDFSQNLTIRPDDTIIVP
ncbi:MAG TPA: polysaccharide biosynthesis/export family protein [Desulfobacterales bacterium]|nr:polysaccharide biosynthesis/export family protein [Desulfobacterales bacterium]